MANKMRSGLSTLGIVIGMMSVIVMMAIGQGAEQSIMDQMKDLLKNKFSVTAGGGYSQRDEETGWPGKYIKKVEFSADTIDYIQYYFPSLIWKISYTIPLNGGDVKIGNNRAYVSLQGVPQSWFKINEKTIIEGLGLQSMHYEKMNFVAVINNKFKEELFKKLSPIGRKIRVGKKEYTIIWVLDKEEHEWEPAAYIPDTTAIKRVLYKDQLRGFEVFLDPEEDNQLWQNRIMYLLLKKFNLSNQASSGIEIRSSRKYAEKYKDTSDMFRYLLLGIGAISLLVWGIGVMNIMIVSVTERTREIWIRKAIWALNRDIVLQFLIESVVITLVGWVFAFLLSYWITYALNKFIFAVAEWPRGDFRAVIDLQVAVIAFSLTAFTGILFGILPARKAAKLKPIDALRFE